MGPTAAVVDFSKPIWKWHHCLGHLGLSNMRNLIKISNSINISDKDIKKVLGTVCPVCATTRALTHIPQDPAR